jgi:hypothetical protein
VPPKRRRYQFSLRTLLLLPIVLALVLSAVYSWPGVHRRYILWRLEDYVDRDLSRLPNEQKQQVDAWIEKLVGEDRKWGSDILNPATNWLLHTVEVPGAGRQLYFVKTKTTELMYVICILYTLDSSGRLVRSVDCPLDYFGESIASVAFDELHGLPCLIVETESKTGKTRQFYHVANEQIELLRCKDEHGTCEMTTRYSSYFPNSTMEELIWQNELNSSDRLEQLRGLSVFFVIPAPTKPIDGKTRSRLRELTASPDPWISEEAKLALKKAK